MDTYIEKYNQTRGEIQLLVTAVIFGTFGIFARLLSTQIHSTQLAFLLNLVQFLFFSAWAYTKRDNLRIIPHSRLELAIFVVLNLLPLFFFINAVNWLAIGAVLLVQNTVTLFTSLALEYSKTRQVSPLQLSLMVIALAALAIIYLPFDLNSAVGFLYAFGVGFFNALANNYRKSLGAHYSAEQLSLYSSGIGTLVWGALALALTASLPINITFTGLGLLAVYACFNVLTSLLINRGFASVSLTLGNVILLLEIVVGYALGALIFGEQFGLYQAVGSVILFSAIFGMRVLPAPQETRKN